MRKNYKKIIGMLIAVIVIGCSGLFYGKAQAANCTATINFNPVVSGNTVTLQGQVTVNNLDKNSIGNGYTCYPTTFGGYPAIDIGFHRYDIIGDGVADNITKTFTSSGSSQTFDYSTNVDIQSLRLVNGSVKIQACVFPRSSSGSDGTPLMCSEQTTITSTQTSTPPAASGSNCFVNAQWYVNNGNGTNSLVSGSVQTDANKQYYAVADFNNCVGYAKPQIVVVMHDASGNSKGVISNAVVADSITQSPESHNIPIKFSQSGSYGFTVLAKGPGGAPFSQESSYLDVTVPNGTAANNNTTQTSSQQNTTSQQTPGGQTQATSKLDCTKTPNSNDCLINPLPDNDLVSMFLRIIKYLLGILGGVSVGFIIVGGFRIVMSQGNSEAYESGQKTITWAVLGLVIALLSFSIVAIVQNILNAATPTISR